MFKTKTRRTKEGQSSTNKSSAEEERREKKSASEELNRHRESRCTVEISAKQMAGG